MPKRAIHLNGAARGPLPGEISLAQLEKLWGLKRTRVWTLVVRDGVIPSRYDNYQWFVKLEDAKAYQHQPERGRPRTEGSTING